jgi:AcrR family transcriptional regulator
MDEIASEAGISRMVLYRYFGDKGGLYRALAETYIDALMVELRDAIESTDNPVTRLNETVDAYVRFIEDNKESYDFLMHRAIREGKEAGETVADFMRRVAEQIATVLSFEISRLGFDPDPAEAWAHGVVGMVHQSTDWWLRNQTVDRDKFVRYLVGLLSRGFFGLAEDGQWPGGEPFDKLPA